MPGLFHSSPLAWFKKRLLHCSKKHVTLFFWILHPYTKFFLSGIHELRFILFGNPNPIELTSNNSPEWVPYACDSRPIRLGFLSQTLGILVPNAWDFCPKRLGFLSRTLGIRWCDRLAWVAYAMLRWSFTSWNVFTNSYTPFCLVPKEDLKIDFFQSLKKEF